MKIIWFLIALLALPAYIRAAPSSTQRWHIALFPRPALLGAPSPDRVIRLKNGAYTDLPAVPDLFAQLKSIAAATPRTVVLAQSADHITWITRTKGFGFPDYTTAQITPDGVTLYARLRFGNHDYGVNAARLTLWRKLLTAP